ncbi:hypothetical protein [Serratia marcescens]|uniref:hypothetical protein n=1 Tax=Serratia marcescens TaxID=615 RepID=UPI0028147158|nr:hypothetical protein [Serratia marcescens]MDQ9784084.1 hypothetical protein [Serratia marcescens]
MSSPAADKFSSPIPEHQPNSPSVNVSENEAETGGPIGSPTHDKEADAEKISSPVLNKEAETGTTLFNAEST